MWEFTAETEIARAPEDVWRFLVDIEGWWLASNPDHIALHIEDEDARLRVGLPIVIEEVVAGLRGRGRGTITEMVEGERVCWESGRMLYQVLGIPLAVSEGVRWRVAALPGGRSVLSATVWARFPAGAWGRLAEFVAKRLLNGLQQDYQHASAELEYVKRRLEGA